MCDLTHMPTTGVTWFLCGDAVCSRQRKLRNRPAAPGRAGIIVCDAESVLFEWIRGADETLSREVQSLLR